MGMDEILYQSKSQKRRVEKQLEAESFLKERAEREILERWEQAQIKAAGIQSALDYAIEQYEQHKDELDEKVQQDVEEQIEERKKEIREFLMAEKDKYLESIGIQAD